MATLRQLRNRVSSISNIQRVTNAMQLVAAAKMRRAQEAILAARPYAVQLDRVLGQLSANIDMEQHPLLTERSVEKVGFAVITSDRGLCGGFNTNISRKGLGEIQELEDIDSGVIAIGRKGRTFFNNRGQDILTDYIDVFRDMNFGKAVAITDDLTRRFVSGELDRVVMVYSQFLSVARQQPVAEQLLPIVPKELDESEQAGEYLLEPSVEGLLETLVPRHVNFQVWRALLESNAGEQAARMTAMDNATKNCGELIEELTRESNKARQSSITLELMDIIGGAEAVA